MTTLLLQSLYVQPFIFRLPSMEPELFEPVASCQESVELMRDFGFHAPLVSTCRHWISAIGRSRRLDVRALQCLWVIHGR